MRLDEARLARRGVLARVRGAAGAADVLRFPFALSREESIDFVLVTASLNFAYTDFGTRERWDLVVGGRAYADADGLHLAFHRALEEGVPALDGEWLAQVSVEQLRELLRGGTSESQCSRSARLSCGTSARRSSSGTGGFHGSQRRRRRASTTTAAGFSSHSCASSSASTHSVGDVHLWKLAQLAVWILEISCARAVGSASRPWGADGVRGLHRSCGARGHGDPALLR